MDITRNRWEVNQSMEKEYMTADELKENRKKERDEVRDFLKRLLDRYEEMDAGEANPGMNPETEGKLRAVEIPEDGRDIDRIGYELMEYVFRTGHHVSNSKYMSFVPNGISPYSFAGSVFAEMCNLYAGASQFSPGVAIIEKKLIQWMSSLAGFPKESGGIFTSGGSLSTLTGMIAARNNRLTEEEYASGVAYCSDQTHSSVKKGMMLMGLRKDQCRIIPSDQDYRIDMEKLEQAILEDLEAGKKPFLMIGTLGTTNTGSIDPLRKMGELAEKHGLWFHVDGAYGGSILLSEEYRKLADGLELADSLTWDQHKWSLQTYTCSCIIARDRNTLIRTFIEHPEYLEDIQDQVHVDAWDMGIEMTRPARAIKLWFSLQALGSRYFGEMVERTIYNAEIAAEEIGKLPGWEIVSPPMCGALNFRFAPKDVDPSLYDEINNEIAARLARDTDAYLVTTALNDQKVIRMCTINDSVTDEDVRETIGYLKGIAEKVKQEI